MTLEGNWDFETGDLSCWMAEGDAFQHQPIRGDTITTARVQPVTLGGDYWDVPYFIGYHGNYWIGTAENPSGDAATGTLTSQEFLLSKRYICFLISGTQDFHAIRVELQIRIEDYERILSYGRDAQSREEGLNTLPKLPAILRLDTGFGVVLRTTGHNSEIMRQECWDITDLLSASRAAQIHLRARLKIVDMSEAGHINVDHFQFVDAVPSMQPPPLWGFADLHCHPMVHLAFGGKLIWGKPTDPVQKLRHCDGGGHGGGLFSGRVLHEIEAKSDPHYGSSTHASCCWPTFSSRSHQEMHIDWIQRAYEGGLRLMCAHAVNNQLLEHLMRARPFFPVKPKDDVQVVLQQTEAMKELTEQYGDWMGMAYSAAQARQLISQGKLAVVLGVEVDQLGGWKREEDCSDRQVAALLHMLYAQGIRMLTPLHLADNAFGGSALYETMFNGLNYYLNGEYYEVEDGYEAGVRFRLEEQPEKVIFERLFPHLVREDEPIPAYTRIPAGHGHVNKKGLTVRGRFLVQEMMRMGMILDIDHMSQKAVHETLTIAEHYDYPLISSHISFRELVKHGASEVSKTREQVARIQSLGGIIAPIINAGDVRNAGELIPALADRVSNDCPESSKSWAQAYLYAVELMCGKGVALGTDFNGFLTKPRPRFGGNGSELRTGGVDGLPPEQRNGVRYAHYNQASERRMRETVASGSLSRLQIPLTAHDQGIYDINTMGLAHYGMLPDFLQDARNVGLSDTDMAPLFRSAEDYIQMWEKCECRSKAIASLIRSNVPPMR